jgi:hypothetical protein
MDDRARLRRLRAARLTGRVPADLVPWLLDLAEARADASGTPDARTTPAEALADQLGDEIAAWMARRGVRQRDLGTVRRTVARALSGDDGTRLASIAAIADALGLDAQITFVERGAYASPRVTTPHTDGTLDDEAP